MNFALAVWGAVVASILAFLQMRDYRYGNSRQLSVNASVSHPFDVLEIDITNVGRRPVRVAGVSVLYGVEPSYAQPLARMSVEKKLEEGDPVILHALRSSLKEAASEKQVRQVPFARIWLSIETPGHRPLHRPVKIDGGIITQPFYERARDFIAADLFVGFPQKPSEFFPIGVK